MKSFQQEKAIYLQDFCKLGDLDHKRLICLVYLNWSSPGRKTLRLTVHRILPTGRYESFERLFPGSRVLNQPELRNCIYRDPFNDLSPKSNAILFGAKSKREKNPNGVPKNAK